MSYNQEECSELSAFSEEEIICPGPLYRVKVFFMGDHGCGKSSLVQSLIGSSPKLIEQSTDGVNLDVWYPFKNTNHAELFDFTLTREQRHLVLEMWDLAGRQICQGVHPMYLTSGALYVVVYNSVDDTSLESVATTVSTIQQKAPGSTVIMVGSQTDKMSPGDTGKGLNKGRNCLATLKTSDQEMVSVLKQHTAQVRAIGECSLVQGRVMQLERVINKRMCFPTMVFNVSCSSGKGLTELRKEILLTALDTVKFPHLCRPMKQETINLYDEILSLRERCSVIITWKDFRNLTLTDNLLEEDALEEETQLLHQIGGILDLKVPSSEDVRICDRYICVHPQAFANSLCAYHLDDERKQFKLEAKRFWPKESGFKKPDPSVLVRSLEKILKCGLVREVLLPLLWQEIDYTDEQTRRMLKVLVGSGLLVASDKARSHCEGLALPNFRSLTVTSQYYCPLTDRLPDCKPQLHWTPKPFKGDVQVGWRYKFLSGVPPMLMKRMMAVCRSSSTDVNYLHCWKFGTLLRMEEVLICLSEEEQHFDICCRANADDPGREDEAVQLIWACLCPLLKAISLLLAFWPGLLTEIFLIPLGSQLFGGEKVDGESGLSLLECLTGWEKSDKIAFREGDNAPMLDLGLLFPFKEKQTFESVDAFIDFLLANRPKILSTLKPTPPRLRGLPAMTKIDTRPTKQRSSKKKKAEIKWDLSDSKSKADPVKNVSVTKVTEESTKKPVSATIPAETKADSPKPKDKQQTDVSDPRCVDINANNKDGDTAAPMTGTGRFLNEEDEIKEANRIASGFVAAVMATAVAEFIAGEFSDNHSYKQVTTAAQVAAAKMTAEAAMAAQTGDIDGAARAVIAAAQAVETVLAAPGHGLEKHSSKSSKVCTIL